MLLPLHLRGQEPNILRGPTLTLHALPAMPINRHKCIEQCQSKILTLPWHVGVCACGVDDGWGMLQREFCTEENQ